MQQATAGWPRVLQPLLTARSLRRVTPNTLSIYVGACLGFFAAVAGVVDLDKQLLEVLAADYATTLRDTDLRPYHAGLRFFVPFLDLSRITAELKGLQQSVVTIPTAPISYELHIAFAQFCRIMLGPPAGAGVLVAFEGLLRSSEMLKIKAIDIVWRNLTSIQRTTIRVGVTKNHREACIILAPNGIAERALCYLARQGYITSPYLPVFGFRTYSGVVNAIQMFKQHFGLRYSRFSPHSLRAGGATYLRTQDVPITSIMEFGRWSSISTTQNYVDRVFNILPEQLSANRSVSPTDPALLDFLEEPF